MAIPPRTSHRHLHLKPGTSSYLESRGCQHFEELEEALLAPDFDREIKDEVIASLRNLVGLAKEGNVDWLEYYSQISGGLRELYLKWSRKSGQLAKVYPELFGGIRDGETPEVYRSVQSQSRA